MRISLTVIFIFLSSLLRSQECARYGKVLISEVFFDTRYSEQIETRCHHFGEYIELFNSSDTPINMRGWAIQDNHTGYVFTGTDQEMIIAPGGYKIITYDGFYAYGVFDPAYFSVPAGGSQSSIGGRAKFEELFPDVKTAPDYNSGSSILLQKTMVLYNASEDIRLYAPTGKIVDQVAYSNSREDNEFLVKSNRTGGYGLLGNFYLENGDGGIFNGPMSAFALTNADGSYVLDAQGNIVYQDNPAERQALYRSTVDSYYSNGEDAFALAAATPGRSTDLNIPLMPLDPYMTTTPPAIVKNNTVEVYQYDLKNNTTLIGQSKTYFDILGKQRVSLSKDFKTNLIWGSETIYDDFGRKWKESFPANSCMGFEKTNYLTNPDIKLGYLDKFYGNYNTLEPYQATATQTYSEINYDKLHPNNVINVVGGNKIDNEWKTGYSYTVSAAQEMYYAFGYNYFEGVIANGKEEAFQSFTKTVSVDANGVESVSFIDSEGKSLAAARSGGTTSYPVYSLIGTQGYVDVHIPAGAPAATLLGGNLSQYKIYNLKTGNVVTLSTNALPSGNGYRIEAITKPTTDPKIYIDQTPTGGTITYDAGALGVSYSVNYYDYTLNVYNKTGQLIKNVQPNGYEFNAVIKNTPSHMQSGATAFISTYTYNDQGQLSQATSPDEGTSKFVYRNDGQIRYSQSQIQDDTKVSYTDYDEYARPIESGVMTGSTEIWSEVSADPDEKLLGNTNSEQIGTIYDYVENNSTAVVIPSSLSLASVLTASGISPTNYIQENLAGNVAVTFSKTAATIDAMTWYSYDGYGRVTWVVQYQEGLGAKTIDYEYDYKGNVKRVWYQKNKQSEVFGHEYTYDVNDALTKVETLHDGGGLTHAEYSYYVTGELKRTNIGQGLQGLDYVYTLGGQLKSINHPSLEQDKDPGHDANDIFGLTLDYHNGDYQRAGTNIVSSPSVAGTNQDFNGNIKAARWANKNDISSGVANQKAYSYNYNRNGWLSEATFGATDNTGVITPQANFKEGALTYDANGNIKTLQRTNDAGTTIDQLSYNYNSNNQLNNVSDAVNPGVNYDIDSQATNNYQYNAIGQLTKNISEGLDYFYNTQGLTTQVKKNGQPVVKFFYNERGQRIKKESYNTSTGALLRTEYYVLDVSGNVMSNYSQEAGSSTIVQTELPIYGAERLGVYVRGTAGGSDYINYQITDHLGNVRGVIKRIPGNPIAAMITFADYYPFGEKLPTRDNITGNYRYAYQGQELDGETGMEAFQLRLWDGRIGRWLNPDPKGQYASPYLGMGNNPANRIDPDGGEDDWHYDDAGNLVADPGDNASTLAAFLCITLPEANSMFSTNDFGSILKGGEILNTYGTFNLDAVMVMGSSRRSQGSTDSVLSPNDWISQFTQPRPNVACKRTCDLIAGFSPVNRAINVARESNNQIVPTNNFTRGIETIDDYLEDGRPITVGVHHRFNAGYNEGTTDHYIVIVGRGITNNQVYYRFYDVATRHRNLGTSPLNRLYLNGNSATGNTAYTNRRTYTLTQVRPN